MNDEGASSSAAATPTDAGICPRFFPISLRKLVIMSICTLGFYEIYWFFCHWLYIRDYERSRLSPGWRAMFPMIFCFPLFLRIRRAARSLGLPVSVAAGPLTIGWFAFLLTGTLPPPFLLLTFCSLLFFFSSQRAANAVNAATDPDHDPNSTFTVLNKVVVVIGGLMFVITVIGAFLLPK